MRVAGRVVGHAPAIALQDVTLRSSNAARLRCLRLGTRDVHAWARGIPTDGGRPAAAVRFRYRLAEPGFRLADGTVLLAAAAAWFEADGSAWCLACPGANVLGRREGSMRLRPLTPSEIRAVEEHRRQVREILSREKAGGRFVHTDLRMAPFLDRWQLRESPTVPGAICLSGIAYGHPGREDGPIITAPIRYRTDTWMETDDGVLYLLGRMAEPERPPILDGRRGRGRSLLDGLPSVKPDFGPGTPGADDDLPPVEP